MAQNAAATCREIADYVGEQIRIATRYIDNVDWRECEALLDQGMIDLCWICGLPYAWKAAAPRPALELCAVPVMRGERYRDRPIYFSDVVVHRQSAFQSFADLRGTTWAYNEPRSHSGFNVVRHHLSTLGERLGYFGDVIESGAHQRSLEMILRREIDASAIDSTVLEAELRSFPQLKEEIRVIETLGPSPMPPWVMQRSLAPHIKEALRAALIDMHTDAAGKRILDAWGIAHFVRAEQEAYASMLGMEAEATGVRLGAR